MQKKKKRKIKRLVEIQFTHCQEIAKKLTALWREWKQTGSDWLEWRNMISSMYIQTVLSIDEVDDW